MGIYQRPEAAWSAQVRENVGRLAIARVMFDSVGWGEFDAPDMFNFGLTFLDEPSVAHGMALDGDSLVPLRYPRGAGGVSRWSRNTKGYYVGAWCFFTVDTLSADPNIAGVPVEDPHYALNHYFTFTGVAIKGLNEDKLDL